MGRIACGLLVVVLLTAAGCTTTRDRPRPSTSSQLAFLLGQYHSPSREPLALRRLTASTVETFKRTDRNAPPRDVYVVVHPAYGAFFRDLGKDSLYPFKFKMLKKQFETESQWIEGQADAGNIVILVVPGNYMADSTAPHTYVTYLNSFAASSPPSLFYVLSETSSTGTLFVNDMVNFYRFLQLVNAKRVVLAGGFIGRCQREFYNQLATYMDQMQAIIIPEVSSVSPDDVTEEEAKLIVNGLMRQDYAPLRAFVEKRTAGKAEMMESEQKTAR